MGKPNPCPPRQKPEQALWVRRQATAGGPQPKAISPAGVTAPSRSSRATRQRAAKHFGRRGARGDHGLLLGSGARRALPVNSPCTEVAAGLGALVLFFIALALHFMVTDYGLHQHHKGGYLHVGRWVLTGAILLGQIIGLLVEIPEPAITVLIAFLAGGVVLDTLKEELPEERQSRFQAFALEAGAYAALLLALL